MAFAPGHLRAPFDLAGTPVSEIPWTSSVPLAETFMVMASQFGYFLCMRIHHLDTSYPGFILFP
jgi:hypothetical protein